MFQILSRRSWVWLQPVVCLFFASRWLLPGSPARDMHFRWTGDSKLSPSFRVHLCLWMIWVQRRTRDDGKCMDVAGFDNGNIIWLRSLMFFTFLESTFFLFVFFVLFLYNVSCCFPFLFSSEMSCFLCGPLPLNTLLSIWLATPADFSKCSQRTGNEYGETSGTFSLKPHFSFLVHSISTLCLHCLRGKWTRLQRHCVETSSSSKCLGSVVRKYRISFHFSYWWLPDRCRIGPKQMHSQSTHSQTVSVTLKLDSHCNGWVSVRARLK